MSRRKIDRPRDLQSGWESDVFHWATYVTDFFDISWHRVPGRRPYDYPDMPDLEPHIETVHRYIGSSGGDIVFGDHDFTGGLTGSLVIVAKQ